MIDTSTTLVEDTVITTVISDDITTTVEDTDTTTEIDDINTGKFGFALPWKKVKFMIKFTFLPLKPKTYFYVSSPYSARENWN